MSGCAKRRSRHLRRAPLYCLVLLVLYGLMAWLFATSNTEPVPDTRNIDLASEIYHQAKQTEASRVGALDLTRIIGRRIQCYQDNNSYERRYHVCNSDYVKGILAMAQREIKAQPVLGVFIDRVQLCPIVYSMCKGEDKGREECVRMERQCVDMYLDAFWRGETPAESVLAVQ